MKQNKGVIMFRKLVNYVVHIIFLIPFSLAQNGDIKGSVSDISGLPLPGANIQLKNTNYGTTSNIDGEFEFLNVPEGYYTLNVSYIGYESIVYPDVWVRPKAYDRLEISMNQLVIEFDRVLVEDSYFKNSGLNQDQSITFRNDEIRRAPGAGQELSRIINSLPSVASVGENRQDMMVRGGGPTENGFIIDNIPIPSISHFNQDDGRSNGPIGLINTEMIESLEFYSNGFSAKYGNRLSSYGDIVYRSGNQEQLEGNMSLGIGGAGALFEGPLGENTTYILSLRRSYLDVIAGALNAGGLPSYDDIQGKLTFKPDHYNTITFLTVNGNSLYERTQQDAIEEDQTNYGRRKNKQQTIGVNYRKIWNKSSFSNSSISYSTQRGDGQFKDSISEQVTSMAKNGMQSVSLRQVSQTKFSNKSNAEYGFEVSSKEFQYDFLLNDLSASQDISIANTSIFSTFRYLVTSKLLVSTGIRLESNDFEKKQLFSPRLNAKYNMDDDVSSFVYSLGRYYQNPPEIYLSVEENRSITSVQTIQQSLTYERLISSSTKLTLAYYQKVYSNAPMLTGNNLLDEPLFLLDRLSMYSGVVSNGKSVADGIELLVEKKRAENFYGLFGASYFNTTYTDYSGVDRNRDYNYQYIVNLIGGYRPQKDWEFSVRWSLFGGKPYTPIDEEGSILNGTETLYLDQWNEARTPAYHSLFLRYENHKNFDSGNLIFFVEFWNAYNRGNTETYYWDDRIRKVSYFDFIPVGGFEYEF